MNAVDAVAAIREAAAHTALVMPPLAAKHLRRELLAAATAIEDTTNELASLLAEHWAARVNEINTYAARARRFVQHEAFLAGDSPDDAQYACPADTLDDALAADGWLAGAGAAHRTEMRLYGPWQIDKPAATTIKESAA